MGLYDSLTTAYPLPSHPEMQGREFQTKDLECFCELYRITDDGRLQRWRFELVEDPPGDGLVEINERWDDVDYHGDIAFYDFADQRNYSTMVTFVARFTDGRLARIWESPEANG